MLLYDYDMDGELDLILGTHTRSAVPNSRHGLPKSIAGQPGAAVLFLRGVPFKPATGTKQQPCFIPTLHAQNVLYRIGTPG